MTRYSLTAFGRHFVGTKADIKRRAKLSELDWRDAERLGLVETVNSKSYADKTDPFPF